MIFSAVERENLVPTISGVARLLMGIAQEGAANLPQSRLREIRGIARGLQRVRLRRLASRLMDFTRQVEAHQRRELGLESEVALLLTECIQTAKFIKTFLKDVSAKPEVLGEVFDCRWRESEVTVLKDRLLIELAVQSEPYEKSDRLDSRYCMDTESGDIVVNRTVYRYPQSEEILTPRPRSHLIRLLHGYLFPGFAPRELRFVDHAETEDPLDERRLTALLERGLDSIATLARRFAQGRRNYFAPTATYELVRVHSLLAIRSEIYAADPTGDLLRIDRAGSPQGVRCMRFAERTRLVALFGRVFRDHRSRLTMSPLSGLATLRGLELIRF